MITELKTQAIYVADQTIARRFYTEKLGFEVRRELSMGPAGAWLEMGPPGARSCVVLYPRAAMKDWEQRKPSIVFACKDVKETHRELSSRGVTFTQPPAAMPWGNFAIFSDPDGNEFGLSDAP